jgi:hypothetical protein
MGEKRSRSDGRIGVRRGINQESIQPTCGVVFAAGKIKQGALALCSGATPVHTVWRWS